jgi:2-keto-4-pentenoate hydratase/2-oxohepta-3-ene-1,7-dioic acid hydratase in catechol pathway
MKLVSFSSSQLSGYGIWNEDLIAVLQPPDFPSSLLGFIQAGPAVLQKAADLLKSGKLSTLPSASARLLAPILNPGKIVAIGLNYMDHCREQKVEPPTFPIVFTKFNTSIIGPGDTISWDPELTKQVDYEVELGVVIGKAARKVSAQDALSHVFGYTVINDISARDLQFGDKQWVRGKSLDTFCPVGPCIITADEIPDPQALKLSCTVNGRVLQDSTTAEMIFGVADLIHRLSQAFTFQPGDLIATGTPDGVGVFRKPPIFLTGGDYVVAQVEKIGRLENPTALVSGE